MNGRTRVARPAGGGLALFGVIFFKVRRGNEALQCLVQSQKKFLHGSLLVGVE